MFKSSNVAAGWAKCAWTADVTTPRTYHEDEATVKLTQQRRAEARELTLAAFGGRKVVKHGGKRYMLVKLPSGHVVFIRENKPGVDIDVMPLSLNCDGSVQNWSREDDMFVLGLFRAETLKVGCMIFNIGLTVDFI
jgi:hypothetical protein